MSKVYHSIDEHVSILYLNNGENRFTPDFIEDIIEKLNYIESNTNSKTLVIHSTHKKIFSNGLDLEWIKSMLIEKKIFQIKNLLNLLNKLFEKILTYPLITIASINGHAFAAGAIMSCSFDFRIMRSDRGFFCLPEIDLKIPFLPGMNAILKKSIPNYMLEYLEYTGVKLTPKECKKHNIVSEIYDSKTLFSKTMQFAKKIKKSRSIILEIKKRLNHKIVKTIKYEDPDFIKSIDRNNFSIINTNIK